MAKKSTDLNFEGALNELEAMIEKMASGGFSLEKALEQFEKGIALARECEQTLKEAEQTVERLIAENGEYKTTPFMIEEE